jgi:cytoskeletal protein CcmA (bactofilin family)
LNRQKREKFIHPFLFPSFRFKGETEIGVNDYIEGDVLVQDGDLTVYGKIKGNILVENGDVILKEGAEVKGDIYTTNGDIKISEGAKFEGKTYKNFSALCRN